MDLARMLADAAGLAPEALVSRVPLVPDRAPRQSAQVAGAVRRSADLERVLALPRRVWYEGRGGRHGTAEQIQAIANAAFRRPGSGASLHLRQAVALQELHDERGLYAAIRVGGGKTLLSLLAPRVLGARRPVLILPGSLRAKTLVERDRYAADWDVPRVTLDPGDWAEGELLVLSFQQISLDRADTPSRGAALDETNDQADDSPDDVSEEDSDAGVLAAAKRRPLLLDRLAPDLVLVDEADCLKHPRSGRTRRVRRYVRARRAEERAAGEPHGTRLVFAAMTGTPANDSILEYAHLLAWALGPGAPVPLSYPVLREWADAIDESSQTRRAVGALARMVDPEHQEQLLASPLATVRRAYARRLVETPGVIAVASSDTVSARLVIRARHLAPTPEQRDALKCLREKWETPDGQPFSQATDLWRHAREVACGFYYRWIKRPPDEWLEARREWCRFVREALAKGERRGWDTELAVVRAVRAGELPPGPLEDWRAVRDTFKPETEAVWLTRAVLEHAAEWLSTHDRGLCWVEHRCVGPELAQLSGLRFFGQGGLSGKLPLEAHEGPAIVSLGSNYRGRNLQRWRENLVLSLPERGAYWEQLLGRTHRDGQTADEVSMDLAIVCREQILGFRKALATAEFAADSSTMRQKLLDADVDVAEPDPVPPGW